MGLNAFDTLVHSLTTVGTRRRLLGVLAALPLGGIMAASTEAGEHPRDRLRRRTRQRNHKQRNRRRGNQGKGGGGGKQSSANPGVLKCDVCTSGCQFTDLPQAIDSPANLAVITLCPGVYTGGVMINRSLTLQSNGQGLAAISGDGQFPVVSISNVGSPVVTVNFYGLAINGGTSGISIEGNPVLNLAGCEISHNTNQVGNGGGILNEGGTITLTDCSVTNNEVAGIGGGIYTVSGNITLSGTRVSGNTAGPDNLAGGGIYNVEATVTLRDGSTVSGNTPDDCVKTTHSSYQGSGCASIQP